MLEASLERGHPQVLPDGAVSLGLTWAASPEGTGHLFFLFTLDH